MPLQTGFRETHTGLVFSHLGRVYTTVRSIELHLSLPHPDLLLLLT